MINLKMLSNKLKKVKFEASKPKLYTVISLYVAYKPPNTHNQAVIKQFYVLIKLE